ncbi:mediator complex subunit 14 [Culex quinquefasciatus]|uniref:Mediator complex subunit 14 n=1 Tax=Culex quinquefasciatus TaxID=7176 RepID=B0XLT5_CULQU|nr:mediator complex subunit 14 [Culex quinquefasciatus]|eukprot:XP_001870606.1 mediator complex subunit 14 [Culex quinquefasciatus]
MEVEAGQRMDNQTSKRQRVGGELWLEGLVDLRRRGFLLISLADGILPRYFLLIPTISSSTLDLPVDIEFSTILTDEVFSASRWPSRIKRPPMATKVKDDATPHLQSMGKGGSQNHLNFNMTSPPDAHIPHPSPSGLMPSSLLNPQPSPIAHLPGPTNMPYMDGQSDTDGSPFTTAHSPAGHYVQSEPQGAGSLIGTRLNIQLYRHSNVILIVEPNEKESSPNEMTYTLYLVLVKPSSVEDSQPQDAEPSITSSVSQSGPGSVPPGAPLSVPELSSSAAHPPTSSSTTENDGMPKLYLKVQSLIEFDTFVAMHDPGTYVNELAGSKRKLGALGEGPSKQQKVLYPAYFIPELAHAVEPLQREAAVGE